jgi:murein DD-endopeptidase MepM/ murein hydrolase activator NlpD
MQKYIRILFIFIFFLGAVPLSSIAIDRSTAGRILDNFKDSEKEILFQNTPIGWSGSNELLQSEYNMNGLEALKARLEWMRTAYDSKRSEVQEKRLSLEDTIRAIDSAILLSTENIEKTESEITTRTAHIQELRSTSLEYRKKIRANRVVILKYLSNIYSESSLIAWADGNIDMLKSLIITQNDTDFFFTDIAYKELIALLGQKFVDEYRSLLKDYYVLTTNIEDEVQKLEKEKSDLEAQKKTIENQKAEQSKLLEITKWREELFQKYVALQNEAIQTVENTWQSENEKYEWTLSGILEKNGCSETSLIANNSEDCASLKQYFLLERQLRKETIATGTTNILSWPVENARITTYFRDPEYYRVLWSQHDAIDIAVDQWTDVRSAALWYVSYVLAPTDWWYSYLAIKHPDGFVTVYGHMSEISVQKYQWVNAGDIIWKSGWAPWTPGAWPMTSGPHLHFEVWKQKEAVDPLRYLTLSSLDFSNLPSLYEEKFISDLIEKTGTGADTEKYKRKFVILGDTETERQKYLLEKYATPDFSSWDTWVDASLDARIDPSFLMCIWLAETTLGNHLKTPYNVWNIGNTDSGSTYSFASAYEWIEWMGKTFGNKYLSKYSHVSELSRWGNEDGTIYASSNSNWHRNIIKCLSALKGRFVEDDYMFRISN